jgi:hypothetical protein
MIAGSVLILAATVLVSAYWLGQVIHNSVEAGGPQAMYLLAAAGFLGLFGAAVCMIGFFLDRGRIDGPGGRNSDRYASR